MRLFYNFDDLPRFRHPVVTMGSYDGVHSGHRQLLQRIVRIAGSLDGESVVVTFSPHPRRVLDHSGDVLRELNSTCEKAMLLADVGIDNLIVAPFTEDFSRISSYDFVKHYLIERIGVRVLVVGYNHHFGHNKEGDYDFLSRLQSEFDFEVYELPRQEIDDQKVSSTIVRELIAEGKMARAARNLGQPYFALLHRDAYGMLRTDSPDKLLPPAGEYKVEVEVWDERAAICALGERVDEGTTQNGVAAQGLEDAREEKHEDKAPHTLTITLDGGLLLDPPAPAGDFIVTF